MYLQTAIRSIRFSLSTAKYGLVQSAKYSSTAGETVLYNYESDPAPAFLQDETQKLLKSITRLKFEKVFHRRSVRDNQVEYRFMTTEQIENELKNAITHATKLLQMPPIVKMRDDKCDALSNDVGITDFDKSPFIFTDISFGLKNLDRSIVIRHTNGLLQNAPENVRRRINQIYFPMVGRNTQQPRMFLPEYLQRALENKAYEFILDRLCVQFEPYDKEFHEISTKVYLHINETKSFDLLRSTRHFGPMAFFLAWHKMIDDLVLDMIKRDYMKNAVEAIVLMFKLNNISGDVSIIKELEQYPDPVDSLITEKLMPITKSDDMHSEIKKVIGKTESDLALDGICIQFIETYIEKHAIKKVQLDLALQAYKEIYNEKKDLAEGLLKAHGIN